MKTFLKLNRWIYIAPFALYLIPISPLREIFALVGNVMVLFWLYAVSTYGQTQLNNTYLSSGNIKVFKIVFTMVPVLVLFNYFLGERMVENNNSISVLIFVILVLSTILSVLYVFFYTAKTITTIENKRIASFKESYYHFILIGLTVVGVFILQPKIQKLINTDNIN
jgi:hypothetical protein